MNVEDDHTRVVPAPLIFVGLVILLFPFLFLLVESYVVKREEVYLEHRFGEAYR